MRNRSILVLSAAAALPLLLSLRAGTAAEPAGKAAPPAAAPSPAAAAPSAGPSPAWKDMTPEQKGKYMKDVVNPKMKTAFQAFDAEEFKDFGCKTCHGKDPKAKKFKMPNAEIYVLPATQPGFMALAEKKPKMMKFMAETVKPEMAKLLGLPELDPKKPEAGGFACMACHTMKKE